MQKPINPDDYELRDEYDLSQMTIATKGRYAPERREVAATGVRFQGDYLYISLSDGREVSLPLARIEWLAWLAQATPEQRANWSLEPRGFAIYWEELDDGIEVRHILTLEPLA